MCVHITTISFFGHRDIEDMILADRCVYTFVCDMMETHEYLEFLVGRDGLFDQIVSSAIIRAKKQKQAENCNHIWVMPYDISEYRKNQGNVEHYYDTIEICEASCRAFPKAAIQIRNRVMVDRSDICVFYVQHSYGGAWETMQYAQQAGKTVVNLAENMQ